ncbi:MAG: nuclear transport factor 2 family protein [Gammaproteobacteria bacterium]|nr:nuclear transport factor 2 family protein [Gammaproteobacteria bacterium]
MKQSTHPVRASDRRRRVHGLVVLLGAAAVAAGCSDSPPDGESADAALDAEIAELEAAVAAAELRLERLRDVDELQNLASAYGHYVDKSQHDQVADLFADDGVVEILGRGVFIGQDRVREYMNNLPPGPTEGSLFNHMHLQPVVHVAEDGLTAHVRARLFVMFGIENVNAQWGSGIYENVFVKEDDVWKLDYLHAYQTFYTDYEDGWAKESSAIFAPYERLPPDRPQSVEYDPYPAAFVPPFHYVNPVSGRSDHYGDPNWQGDRVP